MAPLEPAVGTTLQAEPFQFCAPAPTAQTSVALIAPTPAKLPALTGELDDDLWLPFNWKAVGLDSQ